MRFKSLALAAMAFGLVITSCSKEDLTVTNPSLRVEDFTGEDLEIFGDYPTLDEVEAGIADGLESLSSCDEHAIFRRHEDDFRLFVTCDPWYAFDTVFVVAPVNTNFADTRSGTVSGNFHYMHGEKPDGERWGQALRAGTISCDTYVAPFTASDPDGDMFFDLTFEYDGTTYLIANRKAQITNRNDEGGHIFRVSFKVNDLPNDQYFAVYWQDNVSTAD